MKDGFIEVRLDAHLAEGAEALVTSQSFPYGHILKESFHVFVFEPTELTSVQRSLEPVAHNQTL